MAAAAATPVEHHSHRLLGAGRAVTADVVTDLSTGGVPGCPEAPNLDLATSSAATVTPAQYNTIVIDAGRISVGPFGRAEGDWAALDAVGRVEHYAVLRGRATSASPLRLDVLASSTRPSASWALRRWAQDVTRRTTCTCSGRWARSLITSPVRGATMT